MSTLPESIVLVEGFDDRDFWKGLLLHLGCAEARTLPAANHRQQAGFTYRTPSDTLVHVVPYRAGTLADGDELGTIVRMKLRARAQKPLRRLVLSPDADGYATLLDARNSIRAVVAGACPDAEETADGDFVVDRGALIVSSILVHAEAARDGEGRLPVGVPVQGALEQLACAALCAAYPDRGAAVARWLSTRPAARGKDHKAHAWSFYAGWTTDHGTGDFYGSLWRDALVAPHLRRLLDEQGALRVISALV